MEKYKKLEELAKILKEDGIIAVPTDTVYGISARIHSKKAYDKLMKIKNRPDSKSIPVMCRNKEQIKALAHVDKKVEKLIDAFMPGPITLVLNKKEEAFSYINNAGERLTDELAVRMTPTKELEQLLDKVDSPIFLTSANKSGKPPLRSLEEIEKAFPEIDGIMEGQTSSCIPSTIVDCTNDNLKIQRMGPISIEQIEAVLKEK